MLFYTSVPDYDLCMCFSGAFGVSRLKVPVYLPWKKTKGKVNAKFFDIVMGNFNLNISTLAFKTCQSNPSAYKCQYTRKHKYTLLLFLLGRSVPSFPLCFVCISVISLLVAFQSAQRRKTSGSQNSFRRNTEQSLDLFGCPLNWGL